MPRFFNFMKSHQVFPEGAHRAHANCKIRAGRGSRSGESALRGLGIIHARSGDLAVHGAVPSSGPPVHLPDKVSKALATRADGLDSPLRPAGEEVPERRMRGDPVRPSNLRGVCPRGSRCGLRQTGLYWRPFECGADAARWDQASGRTFGCAGRSFVVSGLPRSSDGTPTDPGRHSRSYPRSDGLMWA